MIYGTLWNRDLWLENPRLDAEQMTVVTEIYRKGDVLVVVQFILYECLPPSGLRKDYNR